MNEFIRYTIEGYTCGSNTGFDEENCQVLGIIDGCSEEEAIQKYFEQNVWIDEAGFTKDNSLACPLLSLPIKDDIEKVIDYLWKDGYKCYQEENCHGNHIFHVFKRLKNY